MPECVRAGKSMAMFSFCVPATVAHRKCNFPLLFTPTVQPEGNFHHDFYTAAGTYCDQFPPSVLKFGLFRDKTAQLKSCISN